MDSNTRLSCARQEDGCHHGYMAGKEFHKTSHVAPNNHVSLTCMTFATVLCVLICVVSLSAVFVLAIKVQMLEAKMNELFKQNEMIYALNEEILANNPTMVDSTPPPVIETPKQIHRKNLTTESLHGAPPKASLRNDGIRHANRRVTRQVSGGSNRCCSSESRCCSENNNQHTFAHLSGNAGSVCGHRWLSWYGSSDENYGGLSVQLMVVVQNTFIRIHRPGYYYVYGQLTYHRRLDDLPSTPVGYSMVRISTCGTTTETTLLETKTTQTWLDIDRPTPHYTGAGRSIDSAHIGGVFYFNYLDEIGIRTQRTDNPDPTRVVSPNSPTDTYNYFGAILLIPYSAGIRTCGTVVRSHAEGCGQAPGL